MVPRVQLDQLASKVPRVQTDPQVPMAKTVLMVPSERRGPRGCQVPTGPMAHKDQPDPQVRPERMVRLVRQARLALRALPDRTDLTAPMDPTVLMERKDLSVLPDLQVQLTLPTPVFR